MKKKLFIAGGVVAAGIVIGAIASSSSTVPLGPLAPLPATSYNYAEKGPIYTAPTVNSQVQEAIQSAQQYLGLTAFSHDGLIDQLSSSAADDYPKDVATAAVNSLNVDYNAQAAKAAQQYLSLTSFSCSGLIAQLDSSAGDKYTAAQASYGAHQTAACH